MVPGLARAALVCIGLAGFAAPVSAQLAIEELDMHLRMSRPAAQLTQVIPVKNPQSRPQQVRVTLGDWFRDSTGQNIFLPLGEQEHSCGERVSVFPLTLQIGPGATEFVRVTYDPTPTDDGCWSIVFLAAVSAPSEAPTDPGSYVNFTVRTGVKVYVHPADERLAGEIVSADIIDAREPSDAAEPRSDSVAVRRAAVRFMNTGTSHLRVRTTFEVRDLGTRLLHSIAGGEALLTPGAVRDLSVRLPTLPTGDYLVIAVLDYGGDEITAAQLELRVP